MHVDRLTVDDRTAGGPVTADRYSIPHNGNRSMLLLENEVVAVLQCDQRIVRLKKLAGAFDNGLESRFDVGWGRRDHLENIAASGLIRQRFSEFAGLGLNLIEQPRILDGDDGLVGEGLHQGQLFRRKLKTRFRVSEDDRSDADAVPKQRHEGDGAKLSRALRAAGRLGRVCSQYVRDFNDS